MNIYIDSREFEIQVHDSDSMLFPLLIRVICPFCGHVSMHALMMATYTSIDEAMKYHEKFIYELIGDHLEKAHGGF